MLSQYERERIQRELKIRGIKSVVLIGSRSTGNFVKARSDYDLYAVTSALAVPFIYHEIKKKERVLKEKLGNEVTLEPLTLWRIKHGKDLLLFKTKNEGTTIFGEDYLPLIKIKSIDEISSDELFSYLFSSIYFLMKYITPVSNKSETKDKLIQNIAKAIMYCAEIQLFANGIYEKNATKISARLPNDIKISTEILNIVNSSGEILTGANLPVENANKFWLSANRYILVVFQQLADNFLFSKNKHISDFIEEYKDTNFSFKKNLQYFILCKMKKQEISFTSVLKRKSIEKHLHCALIYLMLSLNEDMRVNREYLEKVYTTLASIGLTNSHDTFDGTKEYELWQRAKQIIFENWSMACGKSII